jgi:mRNA interferase MazF
MKRGEIWWADLPDPQASEPGYRRPVIIISSDDFNQSKISTILAVIVSSNLRLANAPGNILLPQAETQLTKDSVANVSQIITLDKCFLTEYVGTIPARILRKIEMGLRLVMNL